MSILGSQTLIEPNNSFYSAINLPSVTKSLPGYSLPQGIDDGDSQVVYNLPVDGSNPTAENLTPGYYLYTLRITLSGITWSASCSGNIQFVMDYTENSVLQARRVFRVFVNDADRVDPAVSFTIGIPMLNPSNSGNIAIDVLNYTGANIGGDFVVTINQYNFTRLSTNVDVVSL
jgi:hypothetical protein